MSYARVMPRSSTREATGRDRAAPEDGGATARRTHPGGRRAGQSGTRDAVLIAARQSFARLGYAGTTIRAIASTAEVDPALVLHFFGSKDALFATCLAFPQDVADTIPRILAGPARTVGERLTRFYFELWERPETGQPLRAMFRSVASNEDAARMAHEFIGSHLVARAAEASDDDRVDLRLTLAGGQLAGVMYARHIVAVAPLATMSLDDLVRHVAPSVQRYLTGTLP